MITYLIINTDISLYEFFLSIIVYTYSTNYFYIILERVAGPKPDSQLKPLFLCVQLLPQKV